MDGVRVYCAWRSNPFAFTTLFRRGRKLSMLCASCGLACFADGGNLNDIEQMWIKNEYETIHTRLSSLACRLANQTRIAV